MGSSEPTAGETTAKTTDMSASGSRFITSLGKSLAASSRTFHSSPAVQNFVTVPELDEVVGRAVAKYKGNNDVSGAVVNSIKEEVKSRWPGQDWNVSHFKSTYFIQSTGTQYTSRKHCALE